MAYRILADGILVVHLAFVIFVLSGGILSIRRRWILWLHIPAVLWAVWIEVSGGICPLTPLENFLRVQGGAIGYSSSFVEQYLSPVIYPAGLSREIQVALGCAVVLANGVIYWRLMSCNRKDASSA